MASRSSDGFNDVVRSYKKCVGFDRGRGRVGVNFDNYSSEGAGYYDGKLRLYDKARNDPRTLIWWR